MVDMREAWCPTVEEAPYHLPVLEPNKALNEEEHEDCGQGPCAAALLTLAGTVAYLERRLRSWGRGP